MGTSEGHWCGSRRQRSLCQTEGRWCGSNDSTPELTPLYHIFRTWVTTPSIETSIPAMSVQSFPAPSIFEFIRVFRFDLSTLTTSLPQCSFSTFLQTCI